MERNIVKVDVNEIKLTSLSHIHGQPQVTDKLNVYLSAHFNTQSGFNNSDSPFGPVILTGPSGTGKTMTAKAIHAELGNLNLIETNGVTMNTKAELYTILLNANENTTVFIDEAHGMNAKTQLILLTALSERTLRVPAGTSNYHTIPLANFTMVLATTHEYMLLDALRNRMRIYCRFNYYTVEDLTEIVRQRVDALQWKYECDDILTTIAQRAKGIPRLALNMNLQTCMYVAKSHDRDVITLEDVREAFHHLQIDELGLDQMDRSYLEILVECGRSSLNVLSSKLSLPSPTIQKVVEPYLLKEGFITKNRSSARAITEKGREHIESIKYCLNDGK